MQQIINKYMAIVFYAHNKSVRSGRLGNIDLPTATSCALRLSKDLNPDFPSPLAILYGLALPLQRLLGFNSHH